MNREYSNTQQDENAGPHPARTKKHPIGIDDIGLPSGIAPEELGKLQDIRPDPEQIKPVRKNNKQDS